MKKALGKVIVAFFVCLLSFAVVSPSNAMAAGYCYLGQEPDCVRELPFAGYLLYVDIPPSGVDFIDVTFDNFSNNQAQVNSTIGSPTLIAPNSSVGPIPYEVVPSSSVTFSNESSPPDTLVQLTVSGY